VGHGFKKVPDTDSSPYALRPYQRSKPELTANNEHLKHGNCTTDAVQQAPTLCAPPAMQA